jgi:cellulose biosynthesis protein BcsQ/tetratricopeptide (TPR) repeat protein
MALANIAILLARAGKKVLAVDFDLEAPGLMRFFQEFEPRLDGRAGLLDMLTAQSQRPPGEPVNWRDYVIPVSFAGGSISLMTSGKPDSGYAARVLEFTWNELYKQGDGGAFIEQLRTEWADTYDFTLIDSRTGITDTGGICTIALPDLIVPVFVANRQSLEGTVEVLRRAQKGRQSFAYDRPPALILPVLSRFDMRTEYEAADEWLELLSRRFDEYYADWLPTGIPPRKILERTKLPYVAYFGFGEKLAVVREGVSDPESLGYALNSVAQLIETNLAAAGALTAGAGVVPAETLPGRTVVVHEQLAGGPAIMGGVPPQNPNFTGREEMLHAIRSRFRGGGSSAALVHTLHGLGGVGKTQLAAEYAWQFQSDYGLIWWIQADDEVSVRRSLVSLARRIGLAESADTTVTVEAVLDQLRIGNPTARWLLVYDAADEPGMVRRYLPSGPGHVLITSRNRGWIGQTAVSEVDVFSLHESIEFLRNRWASITYEEAQALAGELGCLPLALEQAVAVHQETGMPLAEYIALIDARPTQVLDEGGTSAYPRSLVRTLGLAFSGLREASPGAAQLLEHCSFLSSSPIAVQMLARGRGAGLPAELAEVLRDDMKLRLAVRDIGRYALAQIDPGHDSIKIHMLVRALLRDGLSPEKRAAAEHATHELLALANPGSPDDDSTWSQHEQIAPHVIPSRVITSGDPHVRRIVIDQIRYFYVTGNYAESAALAGRAVDTWSGLLPPDDEMTLLAHFHRGNALRSLGHYAEARKINEQTFERMRATLGPEHEYTLRVANSRGADLRLFGNFRMANRVDRDTRTHYRNILDDDDPATLRSANNLAVDHRLLGMSAKALQIDEETLRRRARMLGDDHPEVLSSVTAVVRNLYDLGEYEHALVRARESLAKFVPLLPNHPFILLAKGNLAILERKAGHGPTALELSRANLDQAVSLFGRRHEHSLAAMMTLSNALRACAELTKALSAGEEALDRYRAQFGREHPFSLACAINLAITCRALGQIDRADSLDRATAEALARVLPANHPFSLCCACSLSNNLAAQGKAAEAHAASKDVHDRAQHALAPGHPMTLVLAANLALDLAATGAAQPAAALHGETVERLGTKLGPQHPVTAAVQRGLRSEWETEVPPT